MEGREQAHLNRIAEMESAIEQLHRKLNSK
jgi:hypothetical protein